MIPKPYIAKWQNHAPWKEFAQIEQDLVISRVLVELFSDDFLRKQIAFRGGTALHKLFLSPAARYSEDIDLVQIEEGPIKPLMQRIREIISFFEEKRTTDIRKHNVRALYRFNSEYEEIPLRLKLEINTREHFNVLPFIEFPFEVENEWFSGKTTIKTFDVHELLGTKLRALFQRSKGRDLFDIDYARKHIDVNPEKIIKCYREYMNFSVDTPPTGRQFLRNLEEKMDAPNFIGDLEALTRPEIEYNQTEAFEWVKNHLIESI